MTMTMMMMMSSLFPHGRRQPWDRHRRALTARSHLVLISSSRQTHHHQRLKQQPTLTSQPAAACGGLSGHHRNEGPRRAGFLMFPHQPALLWLQMTTDEWTQFKMTVCVCDPRSDPAAAYVHRAPCSVSLSTLTGHQQLLPLWPVEPFSKVRCLQSFINSHTIVN